MSFVKSLTVSALLMAGLASSAWAHDPATHHAAPPQGHAHDPASHHPGGHSGHHHASPQMGGHHHAAHHHGGPMGAERMHEAPPAQVAVNHCWIRALPGKLPSAAYFTVSNQAEQAVALLGAHSDAFEHTMLHATITQNGQAKMVHVDRVEVPAKGQFAFTPGGHHVMLEVPKQALHIGGQLPVVFWFDRGGPLNVACDVRAPDTLE